MRYSPIKSKFFIENRKHFANNLKPKSVAIFNANDEFNRNGDQFYTYRQNSDFFYLSGIEQEQSLLLIAPQHPDPKLREVLFLLETNDQLETWFGHKLRPDEARKISGIQNVMPMSRMELVLNDIVLASETIYFNFNEYPKFSTEVVSRDHRFAEKIKSKYAAHNFARSAPIMAELRTIKSETEIELIQKAADITEKAFRRILKKVKPGIKEYEVQAEIEHEFTINGANGNAYPPIIASGKNACILHYPENDKICQDGDLLLMDFGAEYANYAADMTRTIPVNGRFTGKQRQFYNLVLKANKETIKSAKAGRDMAYLNNEVTMKVLAEGLMDMGMIEKAHEVGKYYYHGVSHYLGLDTHDLGERGPKGMPVNSVITVEPGLYVKEENLGIRIEDDILIKRDGNINLSKAIAKEVDDIERIMR